MFKGRYGGLSPGEVLIMVLFFALMATIPLPTRLKGNTPSRDSSVAANLSLLRTAIDLYRTEHNGVHPPLHRIHEHLTLCTTASVDCVPRARDVEAGYVIGPY